jgi:penicillin-binding protein 1B
MFVLRAGDGGSPEKLVGKLERLLYQADADAPARAGHFRRQGNVVEVFTRDFRYPGKFFRGYPVRIEFSNGKVASVRDSAGEAARALVIEPELLGSVFGEEFQDRSPVSLDELPQSLRDAVLVTEDRDFYRHAGVSIKRSVGALLKNVETGTRQGGSTLTQQLVKNLYLSPVQTLRRKGMEAVLAVILDARYSKDEILEAYLNEIYLGQHGSVAVNGVGEAARHYFGKDASDLDLAESAMIAAMIRGAECLFTAPQPGQARQGGTSSCGRCSRRKRSTRRRCSRRSRRLSHPLRFRSRAPAPRISWTSSRASSRRASESR